MRPIHPLHIAIILILTLIFFIVKLNSAKDELRDTKKLYKETREISTQLTRLKGIYLDKKRVTRSLNMILSQPSFKAVEINKKVGNLSLVLSSESINKVAIESLMNKILNASYIVSSFKIKRLNNENASFIMEIKW